MHWLDKKVFDKEEKVAAVTNIYNQLGIKSLAEKKIDQYFSKAYQALGQLEMEENRLEELRAFMDFLIHRDR